MQKHAIVLGIAFLGLCLFAIAAGWVFFEPSKASDGLRFLGPLWPYLLGGAAVLAALGAFLAWLASYSASHGHQARIDPEGH
jgi:hypothetical protein